MVTLLGFIFIVVNVFFIELFIPDLIGPVSLSKPFFIPLSTLTVVSN